MSILLSCVIIPATGFTAVTRYVSPSGSDTNTPFTSGWAAAAKTIQAAVAAATNSDTVLVTNGTYVLSTGIVLSKAITLRSVNGSSATFIDGSNTVRCLSITNGVNVNGFTLTNGFATTGGGVYLLRGGGISNCVITGNHTASNGCGGGVYLQQGGTMLDCTVAGNHSDLDGGGVYVNGSGVVNRCTITANHTVTNAYGGGVMLYNGGALLNSTVSGNTTVFDGGGVYLFQGGTVTNCAITANKSGGDGAGVYLYNGGSVLFSTVRKNTCLGLYIINGCGGGVFVYGSGLVNACEISANETIAGGRLRGGGVFLAGTNSILQNCAVYDNRAGYDGGGVYVATGIVRTCTITCNKTLVPGYAGGGLYCVTGSVESTIMYYNTVDGLSDEYLQGPVPFINCCTTPLPSLGAGSITNAPLFVSLTGDYHLSSVSPCINKGVARSYNNSPATDIDGQTRIYAPTVDIGADEYTPSAGVVARSTGPYSAIVGSNLTLRATNSLGTALQYRWDFGDGISSAWTTSAVVQHSYAVTGALSATVLIRNTTGQAITNTRVTVTDIPPVLIFNPSVYTGFTGSVMSFGVTATYPDWSIFRYQFSVDGDSSGWIASPGYSHTFTNPTSTNLMVLCQRTLSAPELTPLGPIATSAVAVVVFNGTPSLRIISPSGRASPPAGTNVYGYGTSIACFITNSPAVMTGNSTQYVANGAVVTGNAYVPINATNVNITLTNNAVLTWLWSTQYLRTATAGQGGSIAGLTTQWLKAGTVNSVTSAPSAYYLFGGWSGDTQGATNTSVCTVTMDRARFLVANFTAVVVTNGTPCWWLAAHGLGTNNAAAVADQDGDHVPTWAEYVANTDPTTNASLPAVTQFYRSSTQEVAICWQGGSNRWTDILKATALTSSFTVLTSDIYSTSSFNVYTDRTAVGSSLRFYRINFSTKP